MDRVVRSSRIGQGQADKLGSPKIEEECAGAVEIIFQDGRREK